MVEISLGALSVFQTIQIMRKFLVYAINFLLEALFNNLFSYKL